MSDVGRKPTDAKLGRSDNPAVWNPPPEPEHGADFVDARIRCESCEILRDQLRAVRAALREVVANVGDGSVEDPWHPDELIKLAKIVRSIVNGQQ
jgi:hypothetical protein